MTCPICQSLRRYRQTTLRRRQRSRRTCGSQQIRAATKKKEVGAFVRYLEAFFYSRMKLTCAAYMCNNMHMPACSPPPPLIHHTRKREHSKSLAQPRKLI